jgi:hypothetical protein
MVDQNLGAIDQLALHRHQADGHLGAANIDGDDNVATDCALNGRGVAGGGVNDRWVDFVS